MRVRSLLIIFGISVLSGCPSWVSQADWPEVFELKEVKLSGNPVRMHVAEGCTIKLVDQAPKLGITDRKVAGLQCCKEGACHDVPILMMKPPAGGAADK